MKIVNGFTPIFHSVIALTESGERRPILLLLCSAKYMFPEDESNATPIGPLEFVGYFPFSNSIGRWREAAYFITIMLSKIYVA